MTDAVTTPWGRAKVLEEIEVDQDAGEKSFVSLVQLLEAAGGERLVRFAYRTEGSVRRGPVTLRGADLERLREELRTRGELARALGLRPP